MNQADTEKYAFLYLCGEKDRNLLLGKRKMTLEDLDRFTYLTDLLGFQKFHAQIWNSFSGEFEEKFEALEHLFDENVDAFQFDSASEEGYLEEFTNNTDQQELWKNAFLKNVSDHQARKKLAEFFEKNSK